MNSQSEILEEIIRALTAAKIRYLIGGSVASSSIGIPRATLAIDVLVEMDQAQVGLLAHELTDRWYLDVEFCPKRPRQSLGTTFVAGRTTWVCKISCNVPQTRRPRRTRKPQYRVTEPYRISFIIYCTETKRVSLLPPT